MATNGTVRFACAVSFGTAHFYFEEEQQMKAIVCEMCSSNDVVKDGDYYVCQNCGTKYTPESARKLMVEVEGKVDVSGSSVKVDTTDNVKRALENARRAKQKEDWEEAEKYYDLIERDEPSNIEAIFYSAYAKAKNTLTSDDIYRRQAVFQSFNNSISIVDDSFDVAKEAELRPMIDQMVADIFALAGSRFVYTATKDGYGNYKSDNSEDTVILFEKAEHELALSLMNIGAKLKKVHNKATVHYYVLARTVLCTIKNGYGIDKGEYLFWEQYRNSKLTEIAEALTGLDNETVFEIYEEMVEEYDRQHIITKKYADTYKAYHLEMFNKMKAVKPSFDVDAAMERSFGKGEQVTRSDRRSKIIWGTLLGLALIGIIVAIVVTVAVSC